MYLNIHHFDLILSPAIAHLTFKDNADSNELTLYKDIYNADIYYKNNFPKEYHFLNEDSPDFLLVADNEWFITDKENSSKSIIFRQNRIF